MYIKAKYSSHKSVGCSYKSKYMCKKIIVIKHIDLITICKYNYYIVFIVFQLNELF